mmetsp:Transcript_37950/g.60113  ORF Transcript_37950/g.60113 Transcript_37950/m.60113 type:complete len:243 (+) Transcript_37950:65-793(+)|eukprot:CAMPEP_0169306224 /NCGR_PEP_ID=MMETSP1017-20121227/600_1 /TAXON_ID=342587 /ORGANISM="Karlodinium micrum, Strain CCMP2283" /LENGTH=242 /DNA_ID=CAMNT_0009399341 /DNA_START=64 /DNA_END=792 /DNA_ORIENTATION=+
MADPGQVNESTKEHVQLEERRRREFNDQMDNRRQVLILPDDSELAQPGSLPRIQTGLSCDRRAIYNSGSLRSTTAASRRVGSAPQLSRASASGRQVTGASMGLTSHASYKSRNSEISYYELQKDAAQKEISDLRSALSDFRQLKDRRKTQSPGHLLHVSCLQMGVPQDLVTQQHRALALPVSMAVQPKWSTELKRMNDKIGERLRWEKKISGTVTGSVCPERWFMPRQTYPSNPNTPVKRPD